MSPAARDEGVALLRSILAALSTAEGRSLARSIVGALQLAEAEAQAADPVAADVAATFARAKKRDRDRRGGGGR